MSNGTNNCCNGKGWLFGAIAALGAFLIVAFLVSSMIRHTTPAPVGEERAEERRRNLAENKSAAADQINKIAWQDQGKGFVRLPIDAAMELTVREWQDPAAARATLMQRAGKAAEPPPKEPEKPSIFE